MLLSKAYVYSNYRVLMGKLLQQLQKITAPTDVPVTSWAATKIIAQQFPACCCLIKIHFL